MAAKKAKTRRFVILPTRGVRATTPTSSARLASFLVALEGVGSLKSLSSRPSIALSQSMTAPASGSMKVVAKVAENGAKLVEMTPDTANELLALQPGIRIVPETFYTPARVRYEVEAKAVAAGVAAVKKTIIVTSRADGSPVAGTMVVAFTDFANRVGAQGTTSKQGAVSLALGTTKLERVYVYPKLGFWPLLVKNLKLTGSAAKLTVLPLDLMFVDELRRRYGVSKPGDGGGVTVGVVDTGVGPNKDLKVAGGLNTVVGEKPKDFADNGEGHGSHVAGIIAARGKPPAGIFGLAPAVTLRSYRVFPKGAGGASNYSI